jgi:signal transduction histidine kinase
MSTILPILLNDTPEVPQSWRVALRAARLAVASGCVFVSLNAEGVSWAIGVWVCFVLCAIAAFFWRGISRPANSLFALFIDIVFFLIWMYSYGPGILMLALTCAFYAYLILFSALVHSWRETLITAASVALFLILTQRAGLLPLYTAVFVTGFVACLLMAQKRLLVARLEAAARASLLSRAEAEKAREGERQRIAADFHDGPLQSFISFQMRLEIVRKMLLRDAAAGMSELEQLQSLCHTQVAELRAFVRAMRPPDDDSAGLVTATSRLLELFQKDTGIVATLHRGKSISQDEPEPSAGVLQLVREALNNAQKHSKASRVAVSMERMDGVIEISIEDDGTGFPFAGSYTLDELEALRLGPVSIKRRVRGLGGEMTLDSRPGFGAGMQIRIPL